MLEYHSQINTVSQSFTIVLLIWVLPLRLVPRVILSRWLCQAVITSVSESFVGSPVHLNSGPCGKNNQLAKTIKRVSYPNRSRCWLKIQVILPFRGVVVCSVLTLVRTHGFGNCIRMRSGRAGPGLRIIINQL